MTSYSPHSLCGASSPSLPLPHILQPQGMAEESLAENQLVPEAGLQTGKEARRASSRMELKRADLKKTLPGKIERGWWETGTERRRHRQGDVRPARLGACGQWVGNGAARTTTSFCDSSRWASGSYPHGQLTGFCGRTKPCGRDIESQRR